MIDLSIASIATSTFFLVMHIGGLIRSTLPLRPPLPNNTPLSLVRFHIRWNFSFAKGTRLSFDSTNSTPIIKPCEIWNRFQCFSASCTISRIEQFNSLPDLERHQLHHRLCAIDSAISRSTYQLLWHFAEVLLFQSHPKPHYPLYMPMDYHRMY